MKRLEGHVALVTGGSGGLGRAIAVRLAQEGASVLISDIDTSAGEAASRAIGIPIIFHDVSSEDSWRDVAAEIRRRFGRLDVLVNNAGILGSLRHASPETTKLEDWRRIFAVNVEGVFLGCRTAIPLMRKSQAGSIINMSSIAGLLATPYATAYGASKAAVRQITKSVAQHCAKEGLRIRCNSIHPGEVRTELWEKKASETAVDRGVTVEDLYAEQSAAIPTGKFTFPEDVAAAAAFLASSDSRQMTGAMIVVDGGTKYCDTIHL
jgi:NAD(P)-dependent dehydrogenase (short-subunit alcohol dehydrogenase family)